MRDRRKHADKTRRRIEPLVVRLSGARLDSRARRGRAERSILARLVAGATASDRLMRHIGEGRSNYVLTSSDGRISMRVRVSIEGIDEPVHRVPRGRFAVDWSRATIAYGSNRITVTRTELRLLCALVERAGDSVLRATLIARTWPHDREVTPERENALAVYVCTLRKRLSAIGLRNALRTVRGVGYRFVL